MFQNFDFTFLESIYDLCVEFTNAVISAFNNLISTLQVFLQLFVSLFTRLDNSNTAIYSFVIIIFAIFVVLAVLKIWRD